MTVSVSQGFEPSERELVARLFWQAFSGKLGFVLGDETRAVAFVAKVLLPEFALVARDAHGVLLGVAGFKTARGGLVGGSLGDLAAVYGWLGALWRGPLLSLFERELQEGVFQLDGIFVADTARGRGVGSTLLNAVDDHARALGAQQVELDVIDTNPRAQALYERVGYGVTKQENLGPLRYLFGFKTAYRMVKVL